MTVTSVMTIQCGLVAAGASGILLPGHVYLLGEPFVVRQFTDGGQHNIMSMIDPQCSTPINLMAVAHAALETGIWIR
jgi:hypothetical protein